MSSPKYSKASTVEVKDQADGDDVDDYEDEEDDSDNDDEDTIEKPFIPSSDSTKPAVSAKGKSKPKKNKPDKNTKQESKKGGKDKKSNKDKPVNRPVINLNFGADEGGANRMPTLNLKSLIKKVERSSALLPPSDFLTDILEVEVNPHTPLEWTYKKDDVDIIQDTIFIRSVGGDLPPLPLEYADAYEKITYTVRVSFEAAIHFFLTLYKWGLASSLPANLSTKTCINKYIVQQAASKVSYQFFKIFEKVVDGPPNRKLDEFRVVLTKIVSDNTPVLSSAFPETLSMNSQYSALDRILLCFDISVLRYSQSEFFEKNDELSSLGSVFSKCYNSDKIPNLDSESINVFRCYVHARSLAGDKWSGTHLSLFKSRVPVSSFMDELLGRLIRVTEMTKIIEITREVLARLYEIYF